MSAEKYRRSIQNGLAWIENNMLTVFDGYNGMYERIRIDKRIRTNWVRPDGNTELAKLLTYAELWGEGKARERYERTVDWLQRVQELDERSVWYGTFPFYLMDGHGEHFGISRESRNLYQNDNGKILLYMVQIYDRNQDRRILDMAERLAGYWTAVQCEEGYFLRKDGRTYEDCKGPCFVLWMGAGLLLLGDRLGKEKYAEAGKRALSYAIGLIRENGRLTTSYELDKCEDWRPASSEAAIALYAFSIAFMETGEERYRDAAERVASYVKKLQDPCGAIVNCLPEEVGGGSDLQTRPELCDLVYTEGFALMGLVAAYVAFREEEFLDAARSLADFLVSIQCCGEEPILDGAWRGAYNVKAKEWDGRADQNNPIDEGGKYSAYTGWCAIPIMQGMAMLLETGKIR